MHADKIKGFNSLMIDSAFWGGEIYSFYKNLIFSANSASSAVKGSAINNQSKQLSTTADK